MLILTITQLDITLDKFCFVLFLLFFIYIFILFIQVLVTWSAVKVDLCACEDKVTVNYFCLILN